jgi:hypothetical protein
LRVLENVRPPIRAGRFKLSPFDRICDGEMVDDFGAEAVSISMDVHIRQLAA